ncbi:hypothetical protein HID58_031352 [Brassica napus]|uniref:Vacuolar protein sorting-associated protein 28 homolog n=1 Tax=Brassica napus TaxID=3708 RepID=A0ABQ7XG14_BRANA|nr:hypothetical protein HID58_031352 [Brassica napus]
MERQARARNVRELLRALRHHQSHREAREGLHPRPHLPFRLRHRVSKLIVHFKTLSASLKDLVPSIERFAETYKMDCSAAVYRLVTSGVPATVEHRAAALNMVAVDQVYPLLSDLSASLSKLSILAQDFEGKVKMKEWLVRLSKMGASDELTEQQARQLHFDLESSYNSFMAALPSAGN